MQPRRCALVLDAELKDVLRVKRDALRNAAVCKADIDCLTSNFRFSEEEMLRARRKPGDRSHCKRGKMPPRSATSTGFGPDRMGWDLSPQGRLRVEVAARRYKDGQAPLILVSGGYVHPNQTADCEALEMKKSLIDDYGVPADSIIVEPHARHTTTNLRNAARLMYRYGHDAS
jgi:DUF218 domain